MRYGDTGRKANRQNGAVPGWTRILTWACVVVVVALVAGFVVAVWTVHRSFPQTDGTIDVPGLQQPVTVDRDRFGIPQIYAETSTDLFFAQGYVQAQDRFFQMDFQRHLTSGTLSSLFGRSAVKTDIFVRTLGWHRVAQRELPLLSTDSRRYLEAYSAGVNAYLADHHGSSLSLEYALLSLKGVHYTPARWTPVDSLAWFKAMAWDLGGNMQDEVERTLESLTLSRREIAELYPPYPYATHLPIVNQGAVVDGVYEQNANHPGSRLPPRPPFPEPPAARPALARAGSAARELSDLLGHASGVGSNAWAVSGEHTASGMPILANDPHLAPSMPSPWYQMGLHCTQVSDACPFDVAGFTFPGVPGVVIGHNDRIAWGFTNLNPDVEDLYLEKVNSHNEYFYDGQWLPLRIRHETIDVSGAASPVRVTIRSCRDGPLVSDESQRLSRVGADAPVQPPAPQRGNGYAVALKWTALRPGRTADALFGIDKARGWQDFRAAARNLDAPSQNLVYADVEGNIGYQAPGHVPIRRTGDGEWPVPGWDPAYQWDKSFVPYDALPSVLNPDDGYVVTANQAVVGPRYPYFLSSSYDYGYRSQRIRDLLSRTDQLTVSDMAAIQTDTYSQLAARLTPLLESIKLKSAYYRQGQNTLQGWDFHETADSEAAAYFNMVWRYILKLTFHDQLPKPAWPDGGDRWWAVVERLVKQPDNEFWDDVRTPKRETRDDILREAEIHARDALTEMRSRVPHDWRWGDLHTLTLQNPTLGSDGSPVAFLFNRGGFRLAGGPSIVDATSWNAAEPGFSATVVPSMRMIVPLGDLNAARWINLGGESGHAYDAHYTDQTKLWVAGQTVAWPFSRSAVQADATDVLHLRPSSHG